MFDDRVYWLWLQHAFGAGSDKPVSIYRRFNSLEEFHQGGKSLWSSFDFISDKNLSALSTYSLKHAEAQLEYVLKAEQNVICYTDEDYPEKLRNIDTPPCVLYYKGEIPTYDNVLTIAVVGSRQAEKNFVEVTDRICYELSKQGVMIVSGGALGIDTAAHRGSLKATGVNTCVLACGLDYPYLMENLNLRNQILDKGGCLITEYPINTGVHKGTFAVRNRIMSALSDGLLVVCAKKKSGTMLTVAHATKQNKDIFAVPGDISNPYSEGTNLLIRDGAVPVLDHSDILGNYPSYNRISTTEYDILKSTNRRDASLLSENSRTVYSHISSKPIHVSALCERTGLKISQIQACITELELLDYIKTHAGQRCSLK